MADMREEDVFSWAQSHGCECRVREAMFGGLRGLQAVCDLKEEDVALTVPEALIIDIRTVQNSSLGQALSALGNFPEDWLLLIWTMVDRHISDSDHASFWSSMPESITTGLNAEENMVKSLKGTNLYDNIASARQHIQEQYTAMEPVLSALLKAYPTIIKAEHLSQTAYTWAINLWYAYAMEIVGSDSKQRQSLVPVANLFNHSSHDAHVKRYSRVSISDKMMRFPVSKPCSSGEQVFLSYGPLPNWRLLLFYGFALQDNSHDSLQISLEEDVITLTANEESAHELAKLKQGINVGLDNENGSQTDLTSFLAELIHQLETVIERLHHLRTSDPGDFAQSVETCIQGQLQICLWHMGHLLG